MFHKKNIYAYIVFLNLLACSPTSTYNIRSFFFDGVPNPNVKISIQDGTSVVEQVVDSTIIFNLSDEIHPPYKERACSECHSKAYMGVPKMKQPELCYQCHDDFNSSRSFLHGPVDSGNCTQCHHPHKSKIEKLLIRNGRDLCLKCHDKDKIVNNRVHTNIAAKNCMECHDPHGGENNMYLQKQSCFNCHEDFTENKQFIHGPVAAGNCAMCHGSHKSVSPKLLLDSGDQLCLNCHNGQDVYATTYHSDALTSACVTCHNPHGSDQEHLLTSKTP